MWLLKFHISVCILCWIAVRAMKIIFFDRYKRYKCSEKAKPGRKNDDVYLPNSECNGCIRTFVYGICVR